MACCSVNDCGRNALARGLCGMHYQRLRANGDAGLKKSLKGEPITARFWSRVKKSSGCWLWQGSRTEDGYGRLWGVDREARAHRLSYELHVGEIPAGLRVLHRCDTPACVRPDHLFLGTDADNIADMHAKGRANLPARSGPRHWMRLHPERIARGSTMGRSNITEAMVSELRARHAAGGVTQRALAAQFGIGPKNLSLILKRKTWTHVT
jgi:hypothetical protein